MESQNYRYVLFILCKSIIVTHQNSDVGLEEGEYYQN